MNIKNIKDIKGIKDIKDIKNIKDIKENCFKMIFGLWRFVSWWVLI